ncbi:MAG: Ig-like domain-containing protein [Planctomycetota bacterium]
MRNVLSILTLAAVLLFAGCGGGNSGSSSSLRVRCLGGQTFCIISCDLGCSQTGCSVTQIAENQTLRFKFSDEVDAASVNGASISIRTATGVAPAGDFMVSGSEVMFVPRVTSSGGVSSFGFQRNESYIISLAGGSSLAQSVTNTSGDGLSQEFTCTVVATEGILDEDQQPPMVELVSPTVTTNAPTSPTIVLRFSELIDTTPLQASLSEASPIRIVLRGTQANGDCDTQAEGVALTGAPDLSTEEVNGRPVSVVTWQPEVTLPGNSCITVRVTADLRDLSGRSAEPARFVFTTEAGVSTPFEITETFANSGQQQTEVSGGTWGGSAGQGARPGLIGGDGRHGSFDASLGTNLGGGVFEWDTTNFLIPASSSLTGLAYEVTNGQFFFTDFTLPAGTTVRFTGPNVPVIRVRGACEIRGTIDVSGQDLPSFIQTSGPGLGQASSLFVARTSVTGEITAGQPGTAGGPGAGAGGNGGDECDNTGPTIVNGINVTNGQPGENIVLRAGHAYAGNVGNTGGRGSVLTPATGVWGIPTPLVPDVPQICCAYFSPGGSGGGFRTVGGQADDPAHARPAAVVVFEPAVAGGSAFDPLPFPPASAPPSYTSLEHFLIGGSGGGGGGSHGYGLLGIGAAPEKWMAGHAGSGGGGTMAIRAGGDLVVGAQAVFLARGGDGVLIQGAPAAGSPTPPNAGISSPGGGGSGGSLLLQSARNISVAGNVNTRGGSGSRVGDFSVSELRAANAKGGDGSAGFFRLEAGGNVAFGGTSTPTYVESEMSGPLLDRDDLSGDTSLWYATSFVFPPTWERYELDVDLGNGTIVTYTDSGEPGTTKAFELNGPTTLPLIIEFQGANIDPLTGGPIEGTLGPFRQGIGNGAGAGINLDPVNGFRFTITYNRALFPDAVVRELRVIGRS